MGDAVATALLALGLVFVVEGLIYALAPSFVEDLLAALRRFPIEHRRLVGFLAIVLGLILVWIAKNAGA